MGGIHYADAARQSLSCCLEPERALLAQYGQRPWAATLIRQMEHSLMHHCANQRNCLRLSRANFRPAQGRAYRCRQVDVGRRSARATVAAASQREERVEGAERLGKKGTSIDTREEQEASIDQGARFRREVTQVGGMDLECKGWTLRGCQRGISLAWAKGHHDRTAHR